MDILEEFNLISEKYANRSRKVIPKRIEDISTEIIELLGRHGYTEDDIVNALSKRLSNAADSPSANK